MVCSVTLLAKENRLRNKYLLKIYCMQDCLALNMQMSILSNSYSEKHVIGNLMTT